MGVYMLHFSSSLQSIHHAAIHHVYLGLHSPHLPYQTINIHEASGSIWVRACSKIGGLGLGEATETTTLSCNKIQWNVPSRFLAAKGRYDEVAPTSLLKHPNAKCKSNVRNRLETAQSKHVEKHHIQ